MQVAVAKMVEYTHSVYKKKNQQKKVHYYNLYIIKNFCHMKVFFHIFSLINTGCSRVQFSEKLFFVRKS